MTGHPTVQRIQRISQITAAFAAIGCIGLWSIYLWANPYAEVSGFPGRLVGTAMILIWIGGLVALFREIPAWLYITFGLAFVPVGFYLLGTPGLFAWIGVLTLVYLVGGVLWHRSLRRVEGNSTEA